MNKKIIGILICIIFTATSIIPSIKGNIKEINKNETFSSVNYDVLFEDNFNDNSKDLTKWTEIFFKGIWQEINQRTEIKLFEGTGGYDVNEGIESCEFNALISNTDSVIFNWDVITDIDSTNWVGHVRFEITDGINWIRTVYARTENYAMFCDSNDISGDYKQYTVLNWNKNDGSWNNEVEIFNNKYRVRMDSDESGWIYDSNLFSSNALLKIKIYLYTTGSSSSLYYRSGFDNVVVLGEVYDNNPPNKPSKPSGMESGKVGVSYCYSSSTIDPENDYVYYWFDWGDGTNSDWYGPYISGVNVTLAHIWLDTGTFPIQVKAKDSLDAESVWSESIRVTMPKAKLKQYRTTNLFFEKLVYLFPLFEKILNQVIK